jgi:hypothetical protein
MAAALTAPTGVVAASTAPCCRKRSLNEITCAALASQVNTPFRIQTASGRTIKVTLAEVKIGLERALEAGRRAPQEAENERFSLVFSGARGELLEQNTYSFEHQRLGRFDLFVVPVFTRNRAKIDYQAVVNRPRNRAFQTDPDTMNENQTKG